MTPTTDTGRDQRFARHVNPGRQSLLEHHLGHNPVLGRRDGPRFHDLGTDRWMWDCHVNGGTYNLGHRHPRAVAALHAATDHLDVGNMWLVSDHKARLAERLAATTEGACSGVVFAVSGGEATDAAIKLARGHTRRAGVVSIDGGYHGHTGLATATGTARFQAPWHVLLPDFVQVPWNDLDALDGVIGADTACVLLESIPATLGMPLPQSGYLRAVARLCRERGALLVLDEVQTGLGRTGTTWSYLQDDVVPDMVTTGKGLSAGLYPMAAVLVRDGLLEVFAREPFAHVSTFAGSDLGCAVSLAVLDELTDPRFLPRVRALGERLEAELAGLACEVRRRGLFCGLRWSEPDGGIAAARALIAAGVWCVFAANDPSVTQLLPPLTLTDEDAAELFPLIRTTLEDHRCA